VDGPWHADDFVGTSGDLTRAVPPRRYGTPRDILPKR